ncbi:MAG: biotin synthase BioB [Bacteroidia bacterium]
MRNLRHDWTLEEVAEIYQRPLLGLIGQAWEIHQHYHNPGEIQVCRLLSIKTGGCPEDCKYCAQSVHYQTSVEVHKLLDEETVLAQARQAKAQGATRFCMGAAWRQVRDNRDFEKILHMIREIRALDMEVCVTLGMLKPHQAQALKEAGLTAYNHNLDTSEAYYASIVSTRTYQDRLETLKIVQEAGIGLCCGGILGLGESQADRIALLHTLATLRPHPDSVPINALVPIAGTPLENQESPSVWEMVRAIATARILMPRAKIRLAAGREKLSPAEQALCFLAGANSIFAGEKLLTTPNVPAQGDAALFQLLGLKPQEPHETIPVS